MQFAFIGGGNMASAIIAGLIKNGAAASSIQVVEPYAPQREKLAQDFAGIVLHIAPEAAVGGPLALVKTGDRITLDVPNRSLHLHISDEELTERLAGWTAPTPPLQSGYWKLYVDHVLQADQGVDLDFLVGKRGAFVPRDNH